MAIISAKPIRALLLAFGLILALFAVGCGGSNTNAGSSPPPPVRPPTVTMQAVRVAAGNTTSNVNIAVHQVTPSLQLIAVGTGNSAGVTSAQVSRGSSATLLLVGNGVVPGTNYQISGPSDVQVTQPSSADFCKTTDNIPCVNLSIAVSPSATPGPRNIMTTNSNGELAVFVGGLLIQ